jgi:L-alanine-DL-glutamate epimerase-like enolase superfamily enzyme
MLITAIEPIILRLDQVDTTRADGTQDAFVVRVHTDDGLVGIGEADTSPYVARTIVEMPSSHAVARGLGELLIGQDPARIGALWDRMYRGSYHYGRAGAALHAMSAIDIALWDIAGQVAGVPVSALLGGRRAEAIPVYASEVMPESPDEVRAIARRAVAAGYRALKLGWGPLGASLERDVELVAAARDELGPERALMIDGGMAYSVKRAIQLVRELEPFGIHWLEEPLQADDYDGYRRLSDAVAVRIAAGEADSGLRAYRALVELGHVDVLQPDLARCGGFTVGRQIAELAAATGTEVVPHCFSTGILVAASLHFTAAIAGATYSEFSVADSPLVNGLLTEPFALDGAGRVAVPAGPGLGIRLNDELVERLRHR